MNDERYKSYLFISRVLRSDLFNALEREVLTDAAEGLLLTRDAGAAQIEDLELNTKAALGGMAAARRIHGTTAAEIFERIRDCGPPPAPTARPPFTDSNEREDADAGYSGYPAGRERHHRAGTGESAGGRRPGA